MFGVTTINFEFGVCLVRWRASSRLVCWCDDRQVRGWFVFCVMAIKFEVGVCWYVGGQDRGWCVGAIESKFEVGSAKPECLVKSYSRKKTERSDGFAG